ncbi:MAG: FAD-dependent oxidoreductase [Chloroflexi bacterium]|nr:FAD-dependent oxidoreductase [Chloroflexota bacterium]
MLHSRLPQKITYACDVLVIGSGVSGYCAAIQAGRCGCDVVLLEKDEVLGGNSGPNLGVGITGADRYNAFGTETGLIQELQEEAAWQDAFTHITPGTMPYNISRRNEAVVQTALEQAGVRVLKRHYAREPVLSPPQEGRATRIVGVLAEDLAAFRPVYVEAKHVVIEASGDGHIGALAGADFDMGSEGRDEFGERSAPAQRTLYTQGTSLVALAQRSHRPVFFQAPPGTPPYRPRVWQDSLSSFVEHIHHGYTWEGELFFLYITETGGHLDTIRDDAQIYELLLKQLWAEWDHIKNGPHREAALYWDLIWVSPKAGKRESRRFLGDVILTQTDLEAGRRFPDDIAYGGHDLDDHQPLGETANIVGHSIPPMYGIPYRACYSRNVENLLLAGRLLSATHLAHSSTRLMRTGGAVGQAVGMAAAICCERGCTPRQVYELYLDELQRRLLQADATLLGRPVVDERDLAPQAQVRASSELRFNEQTPDQLVPLLRSAGNILWDWPETLEAVEVYVRNPMPQSQSLHLDIHRAHRRRRWRTWAEFHASGWDDLAGEAFERCGGVNGRVPPRFEGWLTLKADVPIPLGAKDPTSDADRLIAALERNPGIEIAFAARRWEIAEGVEWSADEGVWHRLGAMIAMRLVPEPHLGDAVNAVNGYHRRFSHGPTNMWISDPRDGLPQTLELSWPRLVTFDTVSLTWDNLTRYRHDTPWESGRRVVDHLVQGYTVEVEEGNEWRQVVAEMCNYHRFRVHRFAPVTTGRLRLHVWATHGEASVRLYRIAVLG